MIDGDALRDAWTIRHAPDSGRAAKVRGAAPHIERHLTRPVNRDPREPHLPGSTARAGGTLKRAVDVAAAGTLLVALAPLLALTALGIAVEDGRPVLFRQMRVGAGGREYALLKFRSMRVSPEGTDELEQVRAGHEGVTRVGRVIRRLKIDELPQLLNVLAGDMSLVGPRPAVARRVREYDALQRRRLEVRPGMTGWAQVNGNTEISWDERIELDVWYVDHRSLLLDLRILCRTLLVVLLGERPNPRALETASLHADSARRHAR